jgi:hypothetical protein
MMPAEPAEAVELYRAAMSTLLEARVPFMVGGGYAFRRYTAIERYTKDMDLFVRPRDVRMVLQRLAAVGTRTELPFPHWLGKVHGGDAFIDVVFSSGNGVAVVDEGWFRHAPAAEVLGLPVRLCPVEETIWSKAFVAERERYDGADIAHLIRSCGPTLDWPRLLRRFGQNWRVLLSHLVLFGFIYPGQRGCVPAWVLSALMRRLSGELGDAGPGGAGVEPHACRGTLLSREQYLPDVEEQGYRDGRLDDDVHMTPADIARWTRAIGRGDAGERETAAEERREDRRCR